MEWRIDIYIYMEYIQLLGTEDIRSAAAQIKEASHTMTRAISELDGALAMHQRFLSDWLIQFRDIMEDNLKCQPQPQSTPHPTSQS